MSKKYNFFANEKAISFHKNSYDGSKMAEEEINASTYAKGFVAGGCHPDFWVDYINGLSAWIDEEKAKITNVYK